MKHPWLLLVLAAVVTGSDLTGAQSPPLVVRCGSGDPRASAEDSWGHIVSDLPFDSARGYGFVGGQAGRIDERFVRGGESGWPTTWREGELKYVFRLPRGEYRVRLGCFETEVARAGLRAFAVRLEEKDVDARLDIFEEAGDFRWLSRSFVTQVYDGWLDLKLVALTADRPPRLSRIGIEPFDAKELPEALSPPRLEGRAGPMQNTLWWSCPMPEVVAGYGLARGPSPAGPFEAVHEQPLHVAELIDFPVRPGIELEYRARLYTIDGRQSALSQPVRLTAFDLPRLGLKHYDVSASKVALDRMSVRATEPVVVDGEIGYHGGRYPARLYYETAARRWQARHTVGIDMSLDTDPAFGKRRGIVLSAEPGDFTQLREMLSSRAASAIGLAAPFVEPVTISVGGRFDGWRFDVERLGDRFRRRTGLDREGLLVRLLQRDRWRDDWEPYGERIGENGDVLALNELVAQIHHIDEGEVEGFLEEHFYLERLIARLALGAVRGEVDAPPESYFLLRDSRNGKWEFFRQSHHHGDWGIADFETGLLSLDSSEMRRVLFPLALVEGEPASDSWLLLWTRFFAEGSLRKRYLRRVEELIERGLSPEVFDGMVESEFAKIQGVVLQDPRLWPFDRGTAILDAPERLRAAHRRRLEELRGLIADVRRSEGEPLSIRGYLLRPRDGSPWVEIENTSARPVALNDYRLTTSLESPGRAVFGERELEPADTLRWPLDGDRARESTAGGVLALWRRDAESRSTVLADFVVHGYQTEGFGYARTDAGWSFFREVDGAQGGGDAPLRAVGYEYVQGVEESSAGDLRIWFKPLDLPATEAERLEVTLRYRPEGGAEYEEVPLAWEERGFRFSVALERSENRPRTEYYFIGRSPDGLERAFPLGAPRRTLYLAVRPEIYITEVCPRPRQEEDSPGEFIELYNPTDRAVSLRGFYLTDKPRLTTRWRIDEDIVIRPGGYEVFYADGLDRGRHTNFKLSNSGEFLGLYGRAWEGNLKIDAVAFRGVPPGYSWGRSQDGTQGFRVWKDPTPGKRNQPKIPEEYLRKRRSRD